MKTIAVGSVLAILLASACTTTADKANTTKMAETNDRLSQVISSDSRPQHHKVRDQFRNPGATLEFFGIKPSMTVVEIWPGGGWYAEILAPYLKVDGQYVAAGFSSSSQVEYYRKGSQRFKKLVASRAKDFGDTVKISEFEPPKSVDIIKAGRADAVLTFRNVHNWMARDGAEAAFDAFYKALKPGGILGVVEHRAPADKAQDPQAKNGYVREDVVIAMAQKAGFKLEAKSDINANPKDTADHPKGVWTLPPVLALKDKDKDKYVAIGESDRMTLKFIKPKK